MTEIITNILAAAIRSGTPILYVTQGEILAQKSGVMNLGLEGVMLTGAVVGFQFSSLTGSPWIGVLAAMLSGALLSAIHAALSILLNVNQIISGLAIVFIGTGVSAVIGNPYVGASAPGFTDMDMGFLSEIPVLGPALFEQNVLVYLSILLTSACAFFLFRTRTGLSIRACGDSPAAADAAGLPVRRIRFLCVIVGGALSALGGAYMSLAYTNMWQSGMTGGRGWIGVALVIFARWHPGKALAGAYLFGGITALQFAAQISGIPISAHILQMVPYLFTVVALIVAMWRVKRGGGVDECTPAALAQPYSRE